MTYIHSPNLTFLLKPILEAILKANDTIINYIGERLLRCVSTHIITDWTTYGGKLSRNPDNIAMLIPLKTVSVGSGIEGTRNGISIFIKLFFVTFVVIVYINGIICQRGLIKVAQHLAVCSSDTLAGS